MVRASSRISLRISCTSSPRPWRHVLAHAREIDLDVAQMARACPRRARRWRRLGQPLQHRPQLDLLLGEPQHAGSARRASGRSAGRELLGRAPDDVARWRRCGSPRRATGCAGDCRGCPPSARAAPGYRPAPTPRPARPRDRRPRAACSPTAAPRARCRSGSAPALPGDRESPARASPTGRRARR